MAMIAANRIHGVTSIVLACAAGTLGGFVIAFHSIPLGASYAVAAVAASALLMYAYCAKCTCRSTNCGHVIPGLLSQLLPARKQGEYTALDLAATGAAVVVILGVPQFWLWGHLQYLLVFWGMMALATVDILLFVLSGMREWSMPGLPCPRPASQWSRGGWTCLSPVSHARRTLPEPLVVIRDIMLPAWALCPDYLRKNRSSPHSEGS